MKKAFLIPFIFFCAVIFSFGVHAGFNVLPTKININAGNKVENLKITNKSDKEAVIKVKAYKWSQDETGKDLYLESKGLTYFPRVMTIKPDGDKFVKIGFDGKPSAKEETFRIIAEEMPQAGKDQASGLKIALRMDIPVFIAPSGKPVKKAELAAAQLLKGKVLFSVKNKGSVHSFVKKLKLVGNDAAGNPAFSDERQGWYVLSGMEKRYAIDVPVEKCQSLKEITIEINVDDEILKGNVNVDKKQCSK